MTPPPPLLLSCIPGDMRALDADSSSEELLSPTESRGQPGLFKGRSASSDRFAARSGGQAGGLLLTCYFSFFLSFFLSFFFLSFFLSSRRIRSSFRLEARTLALTKADLIAG